MADRDQLQVLGLERVRFGRHSRCNDRLEASADGASRSRSGVAPRCQRGVGSQSLLSLVINFHQAPICLWGARTHVLQQRQLPRPVYLRSGSGFGFLQRSQFPPCSCACVFVPVPSLLAFSLPPSQLSPVCFVADRFAGRRMRPATVSPLVSKRRPADRRHCLFPSDEQLRTCQPAVTCLWRGCVKTSERSVGA